MKTNRKILPRQAGATMIEVLVTMVILLVGLLGLAGMMLMSQRSELESYQRVQALVLMQDMVGRINANRKSAACYVSAGNTFYGTNTTIAPSCSIGTGTQQARAIADMTEWTNLLAGSSEKVGTTQVGAMIGARGCVTYDAVTSTYTVTVAWQGTAGLSAPPAGITCASGEYGAESLKQRRVVSIRLRIATLT